MSGAEGGGEAGDAATGRPVADASADEQLELLTDRLVDYRATVGRCDRAGLPDALAAVLAESTRVVVPADLPAGWLTSHPGEVIRDQAEQPLALPDLDAAGVRVVTGAAVAIAETGTIILDAGDHQGRRALTLVPDHHVCVVFADQVVGSVPAALRRLPDPRRPLTLISGPSATSDIELQRVEGVHGPRRLAVLLVVEPPEGGGVVR
ncbi:LutC/YkgG family protein [Natronosporangium hydrolyticum]|uniref:LutC/YkgG family protein n=1 Tax=Natronosporangium hydrolyticum TaxID=2811111 RepID=UPI001EFA2619|nr:LUD domain-containing protein [Natronosporangium hydrolyticum]